MGLNIGNFHKECLPRRGRVQSNAEMGPEGFHGMWMSAFLCEHDFNFISLGFSHFLS